MKSPFLRRSRALSVGLVLSLLSLCICLAGCDKIRSVTHAIFGARHTRKVQLQPLPPDHPDHPSTLTGPRLAIIIDDLGSDLTAADAIFSLHYPLTLSILPNHPHSADIAGEASQRGYQVMLHLPMESFGNIAPEPQELRKGMSSAEISRSLSEMLGSVPGVSGVNNHQGSRVTADPRMMAELMSLLRQRNLFFIDSRTSGATVAYHAAQTAGVRSAFRNVPFLDDVRDVGAIHKQLDLAIRDAKEHGEGIAIGHPHAETLRALGEVLPQAEMRGVRLVFASELVH